MTTHRFGSPTSGKSGGSGEGQGRPSVERPPPSTAVALIIFGFVTLATVSLVFIPAAVQRLPALGLDAAVDDRLRYQVVALILAAVVVAVGSLACPASRRFLKVGQLDAPVVPARWIGLNPKPHETWLHVGRNFAVILPAVTAVAIWFQVVSGNTLSLASVLHALPWALGLSVANAAVEEGICRYGVLAALADRFGDRVAIVASALLFGGVHWFGTPGHLPGVLLAAFLGWLLAKSMVETQGMGWALLLHALVDVPIITAELSVSS